jgi:hypothetical protein
MKRALFLATAALLLMLVLAPVAMAQETTMMMEETQAAPGGGKTAMTTEGTQAPLGPTGGPAILLPAAALLLGSGVLTYAIVRRR